MSISRGNNLFRQNDLLGAIEEYKKIDPAVWITIQSREEVLEAAKALSAKYAGQPLPPLFGVPFALKDNIDVEGIKTAKVPPVKRASLSTLRNCVSRRSANCLSASFPAN